MEDARHEENKRLNAERDILLALAPDKWEEFKEAFKVTCADLSSRSHRLQFECEEPDALTLNLSRPWKLFPCGCGVQVRFESTANSVRNLLGQREKGKLRFSGRWLKYHVREWDERCGAAGICNRFDDANYAVINSPIVQM